jgi:soluble calcium-activated nucleotidase 1
MKVKDLGYVALGSIFIGIMLWEKMIRSHLFGGVSGDDFDSVVGAAQYKPYHLRGAHRPNTWKLALISDLDKDSRLPGKKPKFYSLFKRGQLSRDGATGAFSASWREDVKLKSGHNEAGRGMELSELQWYNGKLLAMDDRTGIVYQIDRVDGDGSSKKTAPVAFPLHILMEGNGAADKGQKTEWATVKDGKLYVGSYGKEYTDVIDGVYTVVKSTNLWVSVIDRRGHVEHRNWVANYAAVRTAGNGAFPGYQVQEAILWSAVHRKWFVLPRRSSPLKYDEKTDENMGANMLIIADEHFKTTSMQHVGKLLPTHGFSSAKFLPGSNDEVIVALKSEEKETKGVEGGAKYQNIMRTFLTVFNWKTGQTLMEETEIPGAAKFEGLEFI